jgi:hypothetical protein
LLERGAERARRDTRFSAAELEVASVIMLELVGLALRSKKKIITRLRIVARGAPRKTARWITLNPPVIAPVGATFLEAVTLAAPQVDDVDVLVLAVDSSRCS